MAKGLCISLLLAAWLPLAGAGSRADEPPGEVWETARPRWQEAIVAGRGLATGKSKVEKPRGPGGSLFRIAGRFCGIHGISYTRRDVAWNGIYIPVEARVGTGDRADRRRFDYVLYLTVSGPKGDRLAEVGHHRAARNGTDDPETGCELIFQGAHEPGQYEVVASLVVVDTAAHKAVLLDRGTCSFTIDPGPIPVLADPIPAKPLPR
jgi:hypothetical protein